MTYLCLVYFEEKMRDALPKAELEAWVRDAMAYDEELRKNGHFIAAQELQSVRTAATLKVRNGKVTLSDGPFAGTKEQLSAIVLIEARDLNEAIQTAAKIPAARYGTVEVRPIREAIKETGSSI